MTREEAIEELKILKEEYWDDDGYGHETKQYDDTMFALDMAIKALEQEPCEDCVSRKDIYFKLTNGAYHNETIEQFIDRLVKELEALPPVTPTRKSGLHWIERFNNEDKWLECPYCHKDSDNAYNYCPNCGAEMESEEDGND